MNKRGFTLLELLVVVLIIGILAGIALPQYKVAVTKSKYATLKNLTKSFYEAEQRYYLANGVYANSFDKLDISVGSGTNPIVINSFTQCSVSKYDYLFCKNIKIELSYVMSFDGKAYCVPYENGFSKIICKEETNHEPTNYGWYPY